MARRSVAHALRIRLRWSIRRLDRDSPEWLRWLTPWGTSLLFHLALLLLLGLVLYVRSRPEPATVAFGAQFDRPGQLVDDLTTLAPSNIAGDPFTDLASAETPSLGLIADTEIISIPELPPEFRVGPELQTRGPIQAPRLEGVDGPAGPMPTLALSAPFSGRSGQVRAKLVRREGGSVESERAVERGLDWLARHQLPDGHWSLDVSERCNKARPCPRSPTLRSDTAATALALLPLLGAGHTHLEPGRYQAHIDRGLQWLIQNQQKEDGSFPLDGAENSALYAHAIATMALCEAYGLTEDPKLREPARRAVAFIVAAQSPEDGGWRYSPGQNGDTSVLGWQCFALRSAVLARLEVPGLVIERARDYLDKASADRDGTIYSYQPGGRPSPVMTAEGLLMRQFLGWTRNHPPLVRGVEEVTSHLGRSRDRNIYYWYYAAQLLHNLEGRAWTTWNPRFRDGLVQLQVQGRGCDRGSWDPMRPVPDRWGMVAGRLYVTSLSLLTLEVYYRYLPLYRSGDSRPFAVEPSATERRAAAGSEES